MSICDSAAAEYALESHLKKLIKRWEEEEFKLMKYRWDKRTGQTDANVTLTASKVLLFYLKSMPIRFHKKQLHSMHCRFLSTLI